ncbi:MAG: putative Ig domain-containing protein, partial [Pirellulaceae bacterium]|nr:putative Ig domain-containing protein [Pirellulaceae bacterium]
MFSSFSMGWLSPLRPASSTRPDSAQLVRLPQPAARQRARQRFRHQLLEQLEPRLVMDSQWQNPARPLDVNNNGIIAPLDALLIIDKLNRDGTGILPPRTNPLDFFYDTSGDSVFSPRDALLVINHLNEVGSSGDPRLPGESETAPAGFISLPLTQLAGTAGQIVRLTADMTIGRIEFNEMGLFVVDDAAGNIRGVPPSSSDYPRLAFEVAQRRVLFSRRDVLRLNTTVDLPAGQHLRVYVLQAATSDGDVQKHLRVRDRPNGVVRVGWEEHASVDGWVTIGDRGFDDVFVDMQFGAPSAVNSPPVLPSLPDRTLPELTTVTFDVTAFDAELPADQIRYTLDVGPTGAVLNSTNGIFTWTPTESQGPGIFPVVIRATDSSGAFDTETITISVLEVNLPPSLAPLADVTLRPGDLWQATAAPSDADLPANRLSFELGAGAPAGLTIDSSTGVLRFTAPLTDRNATYPITVTVRDNGQPNLSASRSFTIRVIAQRTAPVIDAIPNQTIPEMIEKVISVTARDLDLPDDSLLYVLVSGPNG